MNGNGIRAPLKTSNGRRNEERGARYRRTAAAAPGHGRPSAIPGEKVEDRSPAANLASASRIHVVVDVVIEAPADTSRTSSKDQVLHLLLLDHIKQTQRGSLCALESELRDLDLYLGTNWSDILFNPRGHVLPRHAFHSK